MNESALKPQPNWFQRQDKLLTTLGTLIILLTFTVKEQLRDEWKDRAQVIETGRYAIAANEQLYVLRLQLADIAQDIELNREASAEKAKGPEDVTVGSKTKKMSDFQLENDFLPALNKTGCNSVKIFEIVQSEEARVEYVEIRSRAALVAVAPLVEAYGEDSAWAIELKANNKKLNDRARDLKDKATKIVGGFLSSKCLNTWQFNVDLDQLYIPAAVDADKNLEVNEAFVVKMESQAHKDHESFEKKAKVANVIAICLYVLGVLLSFAGKFFGRQDLVPDVE